MKNLKKILIAFLALLGLLGLMGCGTAETTEPQAVALVLNKTAAYPAISEGVMEELVYEAVYSYGEVSSIISDGEPGVAVNVANRAPSKQIDETKHRQNARRDTAAVLAMIDEAKAEQENVDTLTGIHKAAAVLHGSRISDRRLVIVSSGLDTAGMLNFADTDLLQAEPAEILRQLTAIHGVPDLTGLDVTFLGLGQAAGIQQPLDAEALHRLEEIWRTILEAGSPLSLTFDSTPLAELAPEEGLPACLAVPVHTHRVTVEVQEFQAAAETEEDFFEEQDVFRLSEQSVQFVSDSAQLLDAEAAAEQLQPLAAYLTDHPEKMVYLAGMTASVGGDGVALSRSRAQAVSELLQSMGVAAHQLQAVGLGRTPNCLRVDDLTESGTLIEEKAVFNRAVFVLDSQGETAKTLGLEE